jgi:IS5 family transposase
MTRWRGRVEVAGAEELLKQTILTAIKRGYLKAKDCGRVNVDTTVRTKEIRFPTDARLYDRTREVLVRAADTAGIELRQSGKKELRRRQSYGHAKQFNRMKKETKRLKTFFGPCYVGDIERKMSVDDAQLTNKIDLAKRIPARQKDSKDKVYSAHKPRVDRVAKSKANQRYEFGNKAGVVTSAKSHWILGALGFEGNPYDGHTLKDSLKQAKELTGLQINQATRDLGYRGHEVEDIKVLRFFEALNG